MFILEKRKNFKSLSVWFLCLQITAGHLVHLETGIRDALVNEQFFVFFLALEGVRYQMAIRHFTGSFKYWHTGENVLLHFKLSTTCIFRYAWEQQHSVPPLSRKMVYPGVVPWIWHCFLWKSALSQVIPPNVTQSLYVDDVQISFASCNMSICARQLELSINRMTKWADESEFKFSTEKTVAVCFSRKRGLPGPSLYLWGVSFAVRPEHKFLGVIFDKKLTFGSHIKSPRLKSQKKLNVMRVLSHKSWGADMFPLMRIYRAIFSFNLRLWLYSVWVS